jgi:hypothetical protein
MSQFMEHLADDVLPPTVDLVLTLDGRAKAEKSNA